MKLVLIHGFLGSSNDWKKPLEKFQGLENVVYQDLSAFPGAVALRRFAVAGYSMGGRLALHLALAAQDACAGAVLVSAGPGIESEADRAARREQDGGWARRFESEPMDRVLEDWYRQPVFASLSAELRSELIGRRRGNDPRVVAQQLRSFGAGVLPSLWGRLGELRVPILFVAGEKDVKYVEIARRAAGLCPRGRAAIVPGAGHIVQEEQPAAFVQVLEDFLKEVS